MGRLTRGKMKSLGKKEGGKACRELTFVEIGLPAMGLGITRACSNTHGSLSCTRNRARLSRFDVGNDERRDTDACAAPRVNATRLVALNNRFDLPSLTIFLIRESFVRTL